MIPPTKSLGKELQPSDESPELLTTSHRVSIGNNTKILNISPSKRENSIQFIRSSNDLVNNLITSAKKLTEDSPEEQKKKQVNIFYHPNDDQKLHLKQMGHLRDELANRDLQEVRENQVEANDGREANHLDQTDETKDGYNDDTAEHEQIEQVYADEAQATRKPAELYAELDVLAAQLDDLTKAMELIDESPIAKVSIPEPDADQSNDLELSITSSAIADKVDNANASMIMNEIAWPSQQKENQTVSSLNTCTLDNLSTKRMVTIQRLAEVEEDVNKLEEYDDTQEERKIDRSKQIMGRRVIFDVADLEKIGSIECMLDSENMKREDELVKSQMHKTDNDTLSREDSIGANFGVTTQNNLDSIMKSLLDTKLAHRASMKDT